MASPHLHFEPAWQEEAKGLPQVGKTQKRGGRKLGQARPGQGRGRATLPTGAGLEEILGWVGTSAGREGGERELVFFLSTTETVPRAERGICRRNHQQEEEPDWAAGLVFPGRKRKEGGFFLRLEEGLNLRGCMFFPPAPPPQR